MERYFYPLERNDWIKFEKSNLTIVLNVSYVKEDETCEAYISKHNLKHEQQVVLFIISNQEGWHYLLITQLLGLLRGIT